MSQGIAATKYETLRMELLMIDMQGSFPYGEEALLEEVTPFGVR